MLCGHEHEVRILCLFIRALVAVPVDCDNAIRFLVHHDPLGIVVFI